MELSGEELQGLIQETSTTLKSLSSESLRSLCRELEESGDSGAEGSDGDEAAEALAEAHAATAAVKSMKEDGAKSKEDDELAKYNLDTYDDESDGLFHGFLCSHESCQYGWPWPSCRLLLEQG